MAKAKALDATGHRKFGWLDKFSYAAGDFGCNMSFALKAAASSTTHFVFCFHCPDGHTLMDGGELVDALSLIAAVVNPAVQFLFCKLLIAQISPRLPPMLQGVGTAPVGGRHSIENIVSCFIPDALTMLVQQIKRPPTEDR